MRVEKCSRERGLSNQPLLTCGAGQLQCYLDSSRLLANAVHTVRPLADERQLALVGAGRGLIAPGYNYQRLYQCHQTWSVDCCYWLSAFSTERRGTCTNTRCAIVYFTRLLVRWQQCLPTSVGLSLWLLASASVQPAQNVSLTCELSVLESLVWIGGMINGDSRKASQHTTDPCDSSLCC